nr:DUF6300 family protein [Streptomyces sp. RFCAC02]
MRSVPAAACRACREPVLLTARFRHSWDNRSGRRIDGFREATLCGCASDQPAARRLLAFFAVDDGPHSANDDVFEELLHSWLDTVRERLPDPDALRAEEERWRAGDL